MSDTQKKEHPWRRVLVPVDLGRRQMSPNSGFALEHACSLASVDGVVFLIHIVHRHGFDANLVTSLTEYSRARSGVAKIASDADHEPQEQVRIEPQVRIGVVADEIIQAARDLAVDVIVMPAHDQSHAAQFFLGSVTNDVVRRAPCPVLVIPPHVASA